jgi:Flp pilus assembly protein TadD
VNASFALNYALGGLVPWGYHLLNVLLHGVNGLLVYELTRRYTGRRPLSLFTALLFVAHPVHTEAVSYVAGRPELLATAFLLLAWIASLDRAQRRSAYPLSLLSFLAALLSKESAIVLPAILALADWCAGPRESRSRWPSLLSGYSGHLAVAGLYLGARILVLGQLGVPRGAAFFADEPWRTRALTMSQAFVEYLRLLVWPSRLQSDYDYATVPRAAAFDLRVAFSMAALAAVFLAGVALLRSRRLEAFALLFFFVAMAPVSNIVPTGILMAERVLYLPAASVCLLAGSALERLMRSGWPRLTVALCCLLVTAAALRVQRRNLDWRDQAAFIDALALAAPDNVKGQISLGVLRGQQGRAREAELALRRAVALAPDKAVTHGRLGELYVSQGRFDEATAALRISLALSTRFDFVHAAEARVLGHDGDFAGAAAALRRALALGPPSAELHQELGVALLRLGDREGALGELQRAVTLRPELAEAHHNLGLVLRALGRREDALPHLREAARLQPANAEVRASHGATLLSLGRLLEAERELVAAIAIDGRLAEAHNNLGVVHARLLRPEEARREFEEALRLEPQYAGARQNLDRLPARR